MINKVILIGHLGKDPEVRHLEGGSSVASFSLATNENYKDKTGEWQKQTEWHNIVAWGNLAEYAEKWLKKGMLVFIEGKLTHRKYQDKEGNDRYITEVKSASIRMMEKREHSADESGHQQQSQHHQPMDIASTPPAFEQEDDLPF